MRSIITFILIIFTTIAWSQIDTLEFSRTKSPLSCAAFYGELDCDLKDALLNYTGHKLIVATFEMEPLDAKDYDKKTLKHYNSRRAQKHIREVQTLIDKILSEVKVLVIENPSQYYTGATSQRLNRSPGQSKISSINFKKMTSLQEVYLWGNDTDYIEEMPSDFYSTPVKTLYHYNMESYDILRKNIKNKRKDINVIYCDFDYY